MSKKPKMDARDTTGKPSYESVLKGEPALAEKLAIALAHDERSPRYTHGFHTYPAGLHPDAARDLLAAFPGQAVLDPFCGGGTVLVEARAAGRTTFGRDLSSVAMRVSRARTMTPTDEDLTVMRSTARKLTAEARACRDLPPQPILEAAGDWYAQHVLQELWGLLRGIRQVEDLLLRRQLEAIFSSILVKVSWRRSDTSAKRVKHDRPAGTTAILFHKKARELARMQIALREVVPSGTPPVDLALQDAREVKLKGPVDLVLTSPPYPAVYDYLPLQHLRRIWLGEGEGEEPGREIGARRFWRKSSKKARSRWADDTALWTAACARALRQGGHLVVVVGDGLTPTGPVDTLGASSAAAQAAGLEKLARASLLRPDHARESARWEHVLVWRKP
ncbi:MAG: hypothetical protein EA397_11120 [Deltaproteobacteria bacterium]|nr:MAG: hypothetical protein EA397_11120 [Deltaproteobacteria bacterium]